MSHNTTQARDGNTVKSIRSSADLHEEQGKDVEAHAARIQAEAMELAQSLRDCPRKAAEGDRGGEAAQKANGDPVADMARKFARIWDVMTDLEGAQIPDAKGSPAEDSLRALHQELDDHKHGLELMTTNIPAASLEGAMLQVMWAITDADLILSHVEPQFETHCQEYMRRINRCLRSVLDVLENETGTDPKDLGGNALLFPFHPHKEFREAMDG